MEQRFHVQAGAGAFSASLASSVGVACQQWMTSTRLAEAYSKLRGIDSTQSSSRYCIRASATRLALHCTAQSLQQVGHACILSCFAAHIQPSSSCAGSTSIHSSSSTKLTLRRATKATAGHAT